MSWNIEERAFAVEAYVSSGCLLIKTQPAFRNGKQNIRYWADTNPRELHERPLHSPKVTGRVQFLQVKLLVRGFLRKMRLQ